MLEKDHPQYLQFLLEDLPQRGWRLHNLHQNPLSAANQWEARLKATNPAPTVFASYGHGLGASPLEAIIRAIEDGESRKGWRPQRRPEQPQRHTITTDDLLGGLD